MDGPSGILACASPRDKYKPEYIPSKSRIEWSNGARARLVSAEEPSRLRGANSAFLWADEICAFKDGDAFDQAMFGLRLPPAKGILTTTPKASKLMIRLSKRFGKDIRLITGSTYDNKSNLDQGFLYNIEDAYGGTRLGKQELLGELLLASEDALWNPELILQNTVEEHQLPSMVKYAIGCDPATSKHKHSDLTGIVLVGLGEDDRLYILKDLSGKYSPQQWAQAVVNLYDQYSHSGPVTIVVERNAGGQLCIENLTRYRPFLPIKDIFSTANKIARAEPIALLAEQGKLKHVRGAGLSDLEDEMTSFDGLSRQKSPDRMDAMVFAATQLMPTKKSFVVSREFLI